MQASFTKLSPKAICIPVNVKGKLITRTFRSGLIDIKGNEVLPLEYSEVWSFYNSLDPDYNYDSSEQFNVWDALDGELEASDNIDYEW